MPIDTALLKTFSAGTKQFGAVGVPNPTLKGFVSDDRFVTNYIYTDKVTGTGAVTAVGTATLTSKRTNTPTAGDLFNLTYNPASTTKPLVGQGNREYAQAVTSAINSGIKTPTLTWSLANDLWIGVVVKAAGTSVAGKVQVQKDGSNYEEFSFTTSSTANTWELKLFKLGAGSMTGTVTYSSDTITAVQVTADLTAQTLSVAYIASAAEEINYVGSTLAVRIDCVTEAGVTYTKDISEIICSQIVKATSANKKSLEITLGTKETDLITRAMTKGSNIQYGAMYPVKILSGNYTVSDGAITVPSGLKIHSVAINGQTLQEARSATSIEGGYYNYASTTITVDQNLYNGYAAEIYYYDTINTSYYSDIGLNNGYVCWLDLPRTNENGTVKRWILPKYQLLSSEESFAEDGDVVTIKGNAMALAPKNNFYYEILN